MTRGMKWVKIAGCYPYHSIIRKKTLQRKGDHKSMLNDTIYRLALYFKLHSVEDLYFLHVVRLWKHIFFHRFVLLPKRKRLGFLNKKLFSLYWVNSNKGNFSLINCNGLTQTHLIRIAFHGKQT